MIGQVSGGKKLDAQAWKAVQQVPAPFDGPLGTDPKQFGYWFNYFWAEASTTDGLTDQDKVDLCEAFFRVLQPSSGSATGYAAAKTIDTMGSFNKRQVLATLLRVGFERVKPKGGGAGGPAAADARDIFLEKVEAVKHNRKTTNTPTTRLIHLGFRADGRTYDQLVAQGGFGARARAKTQAVYTDYGLDQKWHPFSDGDTANCLFLRKGKNKDNCLHTVVSAAFKLSPVVDYPLLSDPTLFPLGCKNTDAWTAADRLAAKGHKYAVEAVEDPTRPGVIDHTESDLRLYVLAMNKATAFSTSAWQGKMGVANPFPEAAVSEVKAKHIIAQLLIRRKHYFDADALYLYDFDLKGVTFLPDEQNLKVRFGDAFPAALRGQLLNMVRGGKAELAGAMQRYNKKKAPPPARGVAANKVQCPKCLKTFSPVQMKMHAC